MRTVIAIALLVTLIGPITGCHDSTSPPPRVPVPSAYDRDPANRREVDPAKPLPAPHQDN